MDKPKGRPVNQKTLDAVAVYRDTNRPVLEICREFGVAQGALAKHVKRLGINRINYPKRKVPSSWRGVVKEQHPVWKGGLTLNHYGYLTRYAPDHPWPRSHGNILEHVRLMELHIGRRIQTGEVVHHKDGNRLNNALDNLELMTKGEHSRLHRALEQSA